jgi:hypothetical protein
VGRVPAAATVLRLAKRFLRCLCQAVERGAARAGARLDRALGREAGEPVTIDLDATVLEVYGAGKRGASTVPGSRASRRTSRCGPSAAAR